MDHEAAAQTLFTLGHAGRLAVLRLLMRHAPHGVRPADMASALGRRPNTLSNYLSDLERAGLVASRREGRAVHYAVQLDRMGGLLSYLVDDCCNGRADLCPGLRPDPEMSAMHGDPFNVLFICTGNSARSIFAEALLRAADPERFRAFSAGTRPGSRINPYALEVLDRAGIDTSALRAKHLSEFQTADAPRMDFVFTVCDRAADEECAPWPGQPMTGHWGVADPVKATGTDAEKALAFSRAFSELHRRITAFAALPIDQLGRATLQARVDRIGIPHK